MKRYYNSFPGATASNWIVMILGVVLAIISVLIPQENDTVLISLFGGLGSAMFLAGFIGLINVNILSKELRTITTQPFEEVSLMLKLRRSGISDICRCRTDANMKIINDLANEQSEFVIIGSSLKGLIGVGYSVDQHSSGVRNAIIDAMKME